MDSGKVYTLGAMGNLICFNAKSGDVILVEGLVDGKSSRACGAPQARPSWMGNGSSVVGGKGSVAVVFDKDTGKEIWKALSANEPGYAPPMIYAIGGKRQLIVWHPQAINWLDPTARVLVHAVWLKKGGQGRPDNFPTPRPWPATCFSPRFTDHSC